MGISKAANDCSAELEMPEIAADFSLQAAFVAVSTLQCLSDSPVRQRRGDMRERLARDLRSGADAIAYALAPCALLRRRLRLRFSVVAGRSRRFAIVLETEPSPLRPKWLVETPMGQRLGLEFDVLRSLWRVTPGEYVRRDLAAALHQATGASDAAWIEALVADVIRAQARLPKDRSNSRVRS
jgi:hypothetical protein